MSTPTNITILYYDKIQSATTITGSSEVSSLPDDNAINAIPDKVWRTTGVSSETFLIDFGSAVSIDTFCFINHNFSTSGTFTIQANTSNSWVTPAFDTTSQLMWENGTSDLGIKTIVRVYFLTAVQSYRYWRIVFADASNPDGFLDFGRIMAGVHFEFPNHYTYGWKHRLEDTSVKRQVGSFQMVDKRNKFNQIEFDIRNVTRTNIESYIMPMMQEIGIGEDVVLMMQPESAANRNRYSFYGQVQENVEMASVTLDYNDLRFIFRETISDQYND